jgi:uncharacterized SAM-binding protein YcdF (DUF218 family)
MFLISKILTGLAIPSAFLMLMLAWGAWVHWATYGRRGSRRLTFAAIGLVLAGFTPLSSWLLLPLEERFPRPLVGDGKELAGIIVLGGAVVADISAARDRIEMNRSADRVMGAISLARRYPELRVIYSGGSGAALINEPPEATVVADLFEALGVGRQRMTLEPKSRTTHENAVATRALLAPAGGPVPGRWLLVTSAAHMPRAVGSFRQQGLDVLPYPADYNTAGPSDRWRFFNAPSANLADVDSATREWAGLFVYWMLGHTPELLPGP